MIGKPYICGGGGKGMRGKVKLKVNVANQPEKSIQKARKTKYRERVGLQINLKTHVFFFVKESHTKPVITARKKNKKPHSILIHPPFLKPTIEGKGDRVRPLHEKKRILSFQPHTQMPKLWPS
jgi:hypothetical protein